MLGTDCHFEMELWAILIGSSPLGHLGIWIYGFMDFREADLDLHLSNVQQDASREGSRFPMTMEASEGPSVHILVILVMLAMLVIQPCSPDPSSSQASPRTVFP